MAKPADDIISFSSGEKTFSPAGLEKRLKDKLRKREISKEQAQLARIEHQRELFRLRRAEVQGPGGPGAAGTAASAMMNFGNSVIPGAPAIGAAALTAPVTALSRGIGIGDAFSLNKDLVDQALAANRAGQIAGTAAAFFTPTPINKLTQLGATAAGADKLSKIAANAPSISRSVAAQIMSGARAGGGATLASEVASLPGRVAGEYTVSDVIRESIKNTLIGAGMGAALGGAVGVARSPVRSKELDLIKRAKAARILPDNFEPTPDMLRDPDGAVGGLIDTMGRSVTGRRQVQSWLERNFYKPLMQSVDRAKAKAGATSRAADTTLGAEGVRGLLDGPSSLAVRRGKLGKTSLGSPSSHTTIIPAASVSRMNTLMGALDKRAVRLAESYPARGGRLTRVFKDMRAVLARDPSVAQMEEFRQRLSPIANFERAIPGSPIYSNRDVREAKFMYKALSQAMRRSDSKINVAMRDMKELRDAERSLKQVVNLADLEDDAKLVSGIFTQSNFGARWKTLQQELPVERLQALRGAYLGEFLNEIAVRRGTAVNPKQALNWNTMDDFLNGTGKFRREVFDSVLGRELRSELSEMAQISDLVLRTVGRAEGSQTAGREATSRAIDAATDVLHDGATVIREGGWGTASFNKFIGLVGQAALISGLLNGRMARFLNQMASGATVTTGQQIAPAVTAASRQPPGK